MDELTLYAPMPLRSQLFAPEPQGLGTGMVESLASYLARLADSHSVTRGHLMAYLVSDMPNKGTVKDRRTDHRIYNVMRLRSRELNGLQNLAQMWSSQVARHTLRTGIDQLTLLPWQQLVSARTVTHHSQYWCPYCLDERLHTGEIVYWPLLWSVRVVTVCPIHQCPLEVYCHHCQALVPSLPSQDPVGYCWKCKVWLGIHDRLGKASQASLGISKSARQIAEGVLNLLATVTHRSENISIHKLIELLEHCRQMAHCRPPDLAQHLGLKAHTIYRLLAREELINIPNLLSILTGLQVGISDFVQNPAATLVESGYLDNFISQLPSQHKTVLLRLRPGQSVTANLQSEMKLILENALREEDPLPLTSLARQVGVSKSDVLTRYLPQLCEAILQKRKSNRNFELYRIRLANMVASTETPLTLQQITTELKTCNITLKKHFPIEISILMERRRMSIETTQLRAKLETFLSLEPPLSLAEVARRLGLTQYLIRKYYPDVQRVIVQRFAVYKQSIALKRKQLQLARVREAVAKLYTEGQLPSKSKVGKLLASSKSRPGLLTKSQSEAFAAAMDELGLWHR